MTDEEKRPVSRRDQIVRAFERALPFEGLMSHAEFDAVAETLGLDPNGDEIVTALVSDGWRYAPGEYCAPEHRLRAEP